METRFERKANGIVSAMELFSYLTTGDFHSPFLILRTDAQLLLSPLILSDLRFTAISRLMEM